MKQITSIFIILLLSVVTTQGQEGFSVKSGLNSVNINNDGYGSNSEWGIYIGAGYTFNLENGFLIEPAVLFSFVDDLNSLYVPVMAKYILAEKFTVQAGPQLNYLLDSKIDDAKFGVDFAIGGGYEITEKFYVEVRYGVEIIRDLPGANINTISIGGGYRFL